MEKFLEVAMVVVVVIEVRESNSIDLPSKHGFEFFRSCHPWSDTILAAFLGW